MGRTKNPKIKSLRELTKICEQLRRGEKTIGLITGCFDVLHAGHVELFTLAKSQVDCLVVGLESDGTIKLSKGSNRPIFPQKTRAFVLSGLSAINYVFCLRKKYKYSTNQAHATDPYYQELYDRLGPHALLTNSRADKFWR